MTDVFSCVVANTGFIRTDGTPGRALVRQTCSFDPIAIRGDRAHYDFACASTQPLQRTHAEPAKAFPVSVRTTPLTIGCRCSSPSRRVADEGPLPSSRLINPMVSIPAALRRSETAFELRVRHRAHAIPDRASRFTREFAGPQKANPP